jgi:uncharacterized protein YcbK (DUF882 family)
MKGGKSHRNPDRAIINRREVIRIGVSSLALAMMPIPMMPLAALAGDDWIRVTREAAPKLELAQNSIMFTGRAVTARDLSFYNFHTGERLQTTYWEHGRYVPGALRQVNYLFRDYRANEIKAIDPRLLDVLFAIRRELGTGQPIDLISGYRTAATNAMLAAHSEGVATHSMHIEGKASDIHIPGIELHQLQLAALRLGAGGVGYYPQSNFVHVDTGRVRRW